MHEEQPGRDVGGAAPHLLAESAELGDGNAKKIKTYTPGASCAVLCEPPGPVPVDSELEVLSEEAPYIETVSKENVVPYQLLGDDVQDVEVGAGVVVVAEGCEGGGHAHVHRPAALLATVSAVQIWRVYLVLRTQLSFHWS